MNRDEQLIDSLLKEHAKSKGVDEQFLTEVETQIDALEGGNFVDLNVNKPGAQANWKKGVGIGVAACAAFCVAGTMIWNSDEKSQDVVLSSGSADKQLEDAKLGYLLDENVSVPEMNHEVEGKPSQPSSSMSKVMAANKPSVNGVPVPLTSNVEPSLDFGKASDFGDGFGLSKNEGVRGLRSQVKSSVTGDDSFGESDMSSHFTLSKSKKSSASLVGRQGMVIERGRRLDLSVLPVPLEASAENYGGLVENGFISPSDEESRRSTFAVDVDTASYANMRKMIQNGRKVPADSVRIEEMVNYFDYQYTTPGENAEHPFAVQVDSVSCPWNAENKLVRVALQGKEIIRDDRPASNLVFLLDVSGSMNSADKLPLLKQSLKYLLEEMDERDSVSMVVYAGASGVVLPATKADADGRVKILNAMDNLSSGGSTAGGAGIKLAYKIAQKNFIKDGVNRVILATDGDFNVGVSGTAALTDLVKAKAIKGVDISVLGFGSGNLNDDMLESITNNGNGNYSYIDTIKEGRKVLLEDMTGTLVTIARDVKIQVEFNPEQVKEYRLVGYANRKLPNSAFLDKTADAGEVGAGHSVTAFYEVVPGKALDKKKLNEFRYAKRTAEDEVPEAALKAKVENADELLFVKLAYKQPHEKINDESTYLNVPLKVNDRDWRQADADFKFASSVALFGMVLRDSDHLGDGNLELVQQLAEAGKGTDGKGYREEFIDLIKTVKTNK